MINIVAISWKYNFILINSFCILCYFLIFLNYLFYLFSLVSYIKILCLSIITKIFFIYYTVEYFIIESTLHNLLVFWVYANWWIIPKLNWVLSRFKIFLKFVPKCIERSLQFGWHNLVFWMMFFFVETFWHYWQ